MLEISTIWIIWLGCLQPAIIKVKAYYLGRSNLINSLAITNALAQVTVSQKLGLEGGGQGCPGVRGQEMGNCWWRRKNKTRSRSQQWELAVCRTLGDNWNRVLLMGKRRVCWKQTYLLLQFCSEPALHLTFPERNLSANKTRTVCYLLRFAKAQVVVAGPFALHVTSPLRYKTLQAWVGTAVRAAESPLCVTQGNRGPFPVEFHHPGHLSNSAHS